MIVRLSELKTMPVEELKKRLAAMEKEIRAEKGAIENTGKPANAGKYREMKKVRARILTLLKHKPLKEPEVKEKRSG